MKILIQSLTIAILTAIAEMFLPWWILMVISFLVCFFLYGTRSSSFLSGLLGIGLLWIVVALYINISTSSLLADRVASIFQLPDSVIGIPGSFLLVIITGLIGGLAGGFSALSGHLLREVFSR
jgi:hypothetical protein